MQRVPRVLVTSIGATALIATVLGCSRSMYRHQADREVYQAILQKEQALGLPPEQLAASIEPSPNARFFDPSNPDQLPMPPDDPHSHALMQRVDGKKGPAKWEHSPEEAVRNPEWEKVLAKASSKGFVLDLKGAIRMALVNSRDFQREKEDLYLSALDVTFERFQFSPRLALGSGGRAEADGKYRFGVPASASAAQDQKRYNVLTDGSVRWLNAEGGELLAGFANSFVWNFSDQKSTAASSSILNFSLIQPLLRNAGRAQFLERLTQAERSLLANVRQMEQFQNGFYVRIACGRNSGEGPSRGNIIGSSGLGLLSGGPSGRTGAPRADGYLGVLEDDQRLRNLESNVARLRESFDQLSAAFDAGRISSRLQVDQARQALFNAQSNLLSAKAAYETRLDSYKIELGLPPTVHLTVQDPLLDRLRLSDPSATSIDAQIASLLAVIRDREKELSAEDLRKQSGALLQVTTRLNALLEVARKDLATLQRVLPSRKAQLERLRASSTDEELSIEPVVLDPSTLDTKAQKFTQRSAQQQEELTATIAEIRAWETALPEKPLPAARSELIELASKTSGLLLSISLNQTATRLETAQLSPVSLGEDKALAIARDNRLDWMNARARLVDYWRKVGNAANGLDSNLTVTLAGSMGTLGSNHPTSFDARTGMLQAGLRFDSPLNRLADRNDWRVAQIEFQRARRDYMLFEDRIAQSLRNTLRLTALSELNFELRRSAVQIAIAQVDIARLRLDEPPRPGATPQFGATTARDLVSALNDLLDAQNDFLSLRIGYDVLRLLLDFELGTMHLTPEGMWADPGSLSESSLTAHTQRWKLIQTSHGRPPATLAASSPATHPSFSQTEPRVR
ncbi:MAG: hypothetical protein RLZZ142_2709 [Verrucomicrobiota bacterium]